MPAEAEYRMPDNFHVRNIGATDTECEDLESCQAATSGTLQASRRLVTVWVELLNINAGDTSAFEVRSPDGEVALSGRFCEPASASYQESFWRFSWSSSSGGGPLEAGRWQAVYLRNGIEEASHTFTLAP